MDNFMLAGVSYQLRFRVCNKPVCRCHDGQRHGPYWYAYSDKLVYLGKELPQSVLVDLARLKCEQDLIKKKVRSLDIQERSILKSLRDVQELRSNLLSYSRGGFYDVSCLRSLRIE